MSDTPISVPFREKDEAKSLGARWDSVGRTWFVPDGVSLDPFARWLPSAPATTPAPVAPEATTEIALAGETLPAASKGTSLSSVLARVGGAISAAFPDTVWVRAEVSEIKQATSGHIFLTLIEHDATGREVAKSGATIWAGRAKKLVEFFCTQTGADFAAGIKVLLEVRVRYTPRSGISLDVEGIDPSYTLGELAAKLLRIRNQLKSEGIFEANRRLTLPQDFFRIAVVSPEDAAGLGDFRAEASRLEKYGLCRFEYTSALFQGDKASASVTAAIEAAGESRPDAVVVIRGGGAVSDLHWVSDLSIARAVCSCPVPVLAGIGHEKDFTIVDEIACKSFGTPSKVVAFIEATIREGALSALQSFEQIERAAEAITVRAARQAEIEIGRVHEAARHALALAESRSSSFADAIKTRALATIPVAEAAAAAAIASVRSAALHSMDVALTRVDGLRATVVAEARRNLEQAEADVVSDHAAVLRESSRVAERAASEIEQAKATVIREATRAVARAEKAAGEAIATVLGMGPERTLRRGFALVRADGKAVSSQAEAVKHEALEIEFHDGRVPTTLVKA